MFRTFLCQQPEIQVCQLLLFLFPVSNIIAIYFESIPLSNIFSFSSKTILSCSLFKEHNFKWQMQMIIYLFILIITPLLRDLTNGVYYLYVNESYNLG